MDKNRITPVFPLVKGQTSRQAHASFPEVDGKITYEHEHGRQGFFGKVSHLYHKNPPTGYVDIKGPFKPELLDSNKIDTEASEMPITVMENGDLQIKVFKITKPMEFYYKNTEGDDIWFVHQGRGHFESVYGTMKYQTGDYIVVPRGTIYRFVPEGSAENFFLIIESKEEVQIPDRGLLGPTALFDPAVIETPEPRVIEDGKEWVVRFKRDNQYTDYIFPYNPCDVVGWKGDVTPWKLSIKDFRPVNSHRYHLPPSVHTTFLTPHFVVCSFVPRPYETEDDALKIPFYHSNVEYDEVIFYHDGDFMSRDNIKPGMMTFHPMGFTHGPHPNALKKMFKQDKPTTQEYAVMIDTRNPLKITEYGQKISVENYWKSWIGAKYEE